MDNFIEVYKKVFDNDYCDEVIKYFNMAEEQGFIVDRQTLDQAKKIDKDDRATFLPDADYYIHHTSQSITNTLNDKLWNICYNEYANKYSILHELAQHQTYNMKIQKTKPGQGYHQWHCENGNRQTGNRVLAWTIYLNDDFEAGETEFLYQQYRYKPSKGDVVIFPAAFTHTHRGNPPIGGDKYIITGWVEF